MYPRLRYPVTVIINIFPINFYLLLVQLTLRIEQACETIIKFIQAGQEELFEKGRSCNPVNCVCDGQFDFCPFTEFMNQ